MSTLHGKLDKQRIIHHFSPVRLLLLGCLLAFGAGAHAQSPLSRFSGIGSGGGGKNDSLGHRTGLEDSLTINFRYLDSSRLRKMDTSINEISKISPQPPTWINLGNMGTPARDLVFSPHLNSGWDHGLHGLDLYAFTVAETKFFNTTRPYSTLGYIVGSGSEQQIDLFHTQNIRPNWNAAFEYRLINSQGVFKNQNSNDNNYRFNSWYQSKNKRYQNFFVLVGSKLQAAENGGIQNNADLKSDTYTSSTTVPVWLGNNVARSSNFFSQSLATGTKYATGTYLMRQQYDLGQKDSIVTDSSVIPLFYPRLRLEHTITYANYDYTFLDQPNPGYNYYLDSAYYGSRYNITSRTAADSFFRRDNWKELINDFSIYSFPDAKNPQQFIKLGASYQHLSGAFDSTSLEDSSNVLSRTRYRNSNVFLHGEYRNKTRNQKWDIEAFGKLYVGGMNAGDYNAYISLKRYVSREVGYLEVGFQNVNRTPSFTFNPQSSFYLDNPATFNKENTTNIFASLEQPQHHFKLSGSYYLIGNYTYFTDYYKARQSSTLFNVLQVSLRKQFTLHNHWKWRTYTILQQAAGAAPVHMPLFLSRNQVGYDGDLGFRNLRISFGVELRYNTPYKADGYSPLTGQFFYQDNVTISQHLPDINGYLHFKIKGFMAFIRTENLNTMEAGTNGFGFTNNNFVAPGYPSQGLLIRYGISWGFVN